MKDIKKILQVMMMGMTGYTTSISAHGGSATLDPIGTSQTFTGLAQITCSSEGSESTDYLLARIRDNSALIPGMLTNVQIYKGNMAISITDTTPGDTEFSPYISLQGGNGVYYIIVNKTDVGERLFDLEWHCTAASGTHTPTDINVLQFH